MSIYAAASGMVLEQRRQEIIARNLVGSEIAGFKREFIKSHNFKADLDQEIMQNTNRYQGTSGGTEHVDLTQGAVKNTHDPLDFAIQGKGFFEVESPDGRIMYTRNGQFTVNADGVLTSQGGSIIQGVNEPIQFAPDMNLNDLRVSPSGELTIDENNGEERTLLDQLRIMTTEDESILKKVSSSNFIVEKKENENQMVEVDTTTGNFNVMNGYLETSNASPIKDMVTMVQSMREFEMGQKMLKSLDSIGKIARQKLG